MPDLTPTPSVGELDGLYRVCAIRLAGIVRRELGAPEVVVEDACQSAWTRFALREGAIARERALSWLATTAVREGRRLVARAERDLPLEAGIEQGVRCETLRLPEHEEPPNVIADRLRLTDLRRLPARQQRLVWLQALGCTHEEIAALSGCTQRTVHRQLHRARRRLRELAAAAD